MTWDSRFTPGMTVGEVLKHGDEIATGYRNRAEYEARRRVQSMVCSVADILFWCDAYREALAERETWIENEKTTAVGKVGIEKQLRDLIDAWDTFSANRRDPIYGTEWELLQLAFHNARGVVGK